MSFHTTNELYHFNFKEAYVGEMQQLPGSFHAYLDNVIILPENSTNRDIREMRCNDLKLKISDGEIIRFIEEGYNVYDANGTLTSQHEDRVVDASEYNTILKSFSETETTIYSIEKEKNLYSFSIDGEEHTYLVEVSGTTDTEEWERYLNL